MASKAVKRLAGVIGKLAGQIFLISQLVVSIDITHSRDRSFASWLCIP